MDCQKALFSLEEEVTNLNMAYMSPLLKSVEAAGIKGVQIKNRPYQLTVDDFFYPVQQLKETFSQLIEADDPQRIALIPSVSYGLATVAKNLPLQKGQEIIVVEDQFPSNVFAWQGIAAAKGAHIRSISPPNGIPLAQRGHSWNTAILEAINSKTALVALPQVHWSEGILFDLPAIRMRSSEVGAWLAVDATQSLGAYPFSVEEIQPDALIAASYKWLLGPYSFGLAFYGPSLDGGTPLEESWMHRVGSEDFRNLTRYQSAYKPKANRYCVGEASNFIAVPMMQAALEQLLLWGPAAIQAYCEKISHQALQQLQKAGFGILPPDQRGSHLFGVELLNGMDFQALNQKLQDEQVFVSFRGNYVRIAPYLYNTEKDFEKLNGILLAHRP